jgi:Holliday junction resolvasome RuvABC ATP-dependent DNA helicase subunit
MQINKEYISLEQLLRLLQLADEDNALRLSQLKRKQNWFMDEIHQLDKQIERSKN